MGSGFGKPTEKQRSGYLTYLLAWVALIMLTGATLFVYWLHLGNMGGAIALGIASCKAGVILLFFMHLRKESRLVQGIFLVPVFLMGAIMIFTFLDVWYRQ